MCLSHKPLDDVAADGGFPARLVPPFQEISEAGVQRSPAVGMRGASEIGDDGEAAALHLERASVVYRPHSLLRLQCVDSLPVHERDILGAALYLNVELRGPLRQGDLRVVDAFEPHLLFGRQLPSTQPTSSIVNTS